MVTILPGSFWFPSRRLGTIVNSLDVRPATLDTESFFNSGVIYPKIYSKFLGRITNKGIANSHPEHLRFKDWAVAVPIENRLTSAITPNPRYDFVFTFLSPFWLPT